MWEQYESLPSREPIRAKKFNLNKWDTYRYLRAKGVSKEIRIGQIYNVSNKAWKIPIYLGKKHPGVFCKLGVSLRKALLFKGTDAANKKGWKVYIDIAPDSSNGLTKLTAFDIFLREIGLVALQHDNYMGELNEDDLKRLLQAAA